MKKAPESDLADLIRMFRECRARRDFKVYGDRTGIDALGIPAETIKRKRGRPRKLRQSDHAVVQLVYKRKLQGGEPFSDAAGRDFNPCRYLVADAEGVEVWVIRKAWERVPARERKRIHDWLRKKLMEHDALHPRHKK